MTADESVIDVARGSQAGSVAPIFPAGTFRPDPRPAARWTTVLAAARFELALLLRNGEQLLLAVIIPLLALIGLRALPFPPLPEPRIATAAPIVLALAVVSSAFTSQAITTAFDRRYGMVKRLAAAGIGRAQLVGGKLLATLVVVGGQLLVIGGVAVFLGWRPRNVAVAALPLMLGAIALVSLALLLGGTLRAEAVLAVANLVWLVLVIAGGLVVPLERAPRWLAEVGAATPAGALSNSLLAVLRDGRAPPLMSVLVLLAWALVGGAGTVRWFRWL